jgi:hypothetical protein
MLIGAMTGWKTPAGQRSSNSKTSAPATMWWVTAPVWARTRSSAKAVSVSNHWTNW